MDGLLKSLEEKRSLLKELLEQVRKQAGIIGLKDLEGLRESIEARQALMDRIDAVDGRIPKGSGTSASSGETGSAALRAEIKALLGDIRTLDDENVRNAGALVESLMTGIRETNAEKNLLAYSAGPPAGSKFVNKKG
jgi:hypothetical protein